MPPQRTPRTNKTALPPPTLSEAAFERALSVLRANAQKRRAGSAVPAIAEEVQSSVRLPQALAREDASEFVARVFAESEKYLDRDPYGSIGGADTFHTKIVGVSFEGRQDIVAGLQVGQELEIVRQPDNPKDANAVAVQYGTLQLGFLRAAIAKHLAPLIDAGTHYRARIASLTGGVSAQRSGDQKNRGVNIFVWRTTVSTTIEPDRQRRISSEEQEVDAERIQKALIGEYQPHRAQRAILERLESGKNTLGVLGTGRGKSFCFHYTAALRALTAGQKTLVLYPLRALANDQHEGMLRNLDPFGLRIHRANGSISPEQREELFAALRDGTWDIILATPEFLEFHREAFTGKSVPHLVVVDEAHHLFESKHRAAYGKLGQTIATLSARNAAPPQILALTATAGDEAFKHIVRELHIDAWVIDPTVRENLHVIDARETAGTHRGKTHTKAKIDYLEHLFERGEGKGIVYCMSRTEAQKIADALRKKLGDVVMFYHAGMPTHERLEVERYFREGALRVIVATSAFGEGIDLPDVRHVVLYHLNFDFTEFNQQAGRAGRDGAHAEIHLLFGEEDKRINNFIIDREAPTLAVLRELYRGMRGLTQPEPDGSRVLRMLFTDIARTLELEKANERTIAAALRIFEEAGLVELGIDDDGRYARFHAVDKKVDLEQTERFAEGEAERENFARFAGLALTAKADALQRIINRPIYPERVPVEQ